MLYCLTMEPCQRCRPRTHATTADLQHTTANFKQRRWCRGWTIQLLACESQHRNCLTVNLINLRWLWWFWLMCWLFNLHNNWNVVMMYLIPLSIMFWTLCAFVGENNINDAEPFHECHPLMSGLLSSYLFQHYLCASNLGSCVIPWHGIIISITHKLACLVHCYATVCKAC